MKMNKLITVNVYLKIFLFFALIGSCAGVSDTTDGQSISHISGSIINFQAKSFTELNRITIITSEGKEYNLNVNKNLGKFTPSHLRQHMALGDHVQVSYIEQDGIKWLEDISDLIP
tara:strand:+ start:1393 stop:1740 length:348 start_codon:yes stop_codon:yes gene_type:complete